MDRLIGTWWMLSLIAVASAGCCCVPPGASSCGSGGLAGALASRSAISSCDGGGCDSGGCATGGCDNGGCGDAACGCGGGGLGFVGPLARLASCRGACGEVYIDEWINHPPQADNCGFTCGGCGQCGQCRPLRSVLKQLWGRPYMTRCSTGLCGPSCDDGGCNSCDGGHVGHELHGHAPHGGSSCNCGNHGGSSVISNAPQPIPSYEQFGPSELQPVTPAMPLEISPNSMPTPAPEIMPSSAQRLNPARNRQSVRTASATGKPR